MVMCVKCSLQSLEILHESSKEISHVTTCGLALAYFKLLTW